MDSMNIYVILFFSFLGRGVVEAPFRTVVDYIHKLQSRLEWDDFLMVCLSLNLYILHACSYQACVCTFVCLISCVAN